MSALSSQPEVEDTPSTTPLAMSTTSTPNLEDALTLENGTEAANLQNDTEPMDESLDGNQVPGEEPKKIETEVVQEDDIDDSDVTLSLPISKIKKIFKMDPDYFSASSGALYATGLATELFVQYLVEQASVNARMEKRKKLQYKDFSSAVSVQDSLHFLSDTVPKSQPIGELIQQKKINVTTDQPDTFPEEPTNENESASITPAPHALPKGQQTLPFGTLPNPPPVKKAVIHNLMSD